MRLSLPRAGAPAIFLFALFGAYAVSAQFSLGARAGIVLTSARVTEVRGTEIGDRELGYDLALRVAYAFNNVFALQVDPGITQRGYELVFPNPFDTPEYSLKSTYLTVPVLAKLGVQNDLGAIVLLAGPSFQYALSATERLREGGVDGRVFENEVNLAAGAGLYRRVAFGGMAGVQLQLNLGPGSVTADARYQHDFTSSYKDDVGFVDANGQSLGSSGKLHHRAFGFSLGYLLPLGKRADG